MCQSQDTFLPGYIVTSSGDTIKGFVLEGSPSFASQQCLFKTDLASTVKQFDPGNIQSVFFSNRLYRSKKIKYDVANQAFFLECLFDGKVDLYKLSRLESDYYFAERGDSIFPLTHTRSEVYKKGKKVQLNTKIYIGVLKWLMQDHTDFGQRIEQAELDDLSLINLFQEYHSHACGGGCVSYMKKYPKRERKHWKLGFGGSLQLVSRSMNIKTVPSQVFQQVVTSTNADLSVNSTSIVPTLQILLSDLGGRTFVLELKYLNQKDTQIKTEFISMPLIYQKQFLFAKKLAPYFLVGAGINYYLTTSANGRFVNNISIPSEDFNWTGLGFSPTLGLGFRRSFLNSHQIQLEVKYELGLPIDTRFNVFGSGPWESTLSTRTFLFCLSYQLFANRN